MKKWASIILVISMILTLAQPLYLGAEEEKVVANKGDYYFRILEISPKADEFDLKQSDFGKNVKLYQYSIKEYNAIREDLLGFYDVIYIGNNEEKDAQYYTLGQPVNKIPAGNKKNGSLISNYDPVNEVYEYWPGNDATELVLSYFDRILDAGQVIVADERLKGFDSEDALIHKYVQNNKDQIMFVEGNKADDSINALMNYEDFSKVATPRPYLKLTETPTLFDGSDESYIDTSEGAILKFKYDLLGYEEDGLFDIRLYLDINGDNKYYSSDYELIKTATNVSSNQDLNFSLAIPEDFRGLQQFKFEVTDVISGAKSYDTGYLAFRGDEPVRMNVLQVACNGNTFNLETDLLDNKGNNLLTTFSDDYEIDVDVITMSEFTKLYNDNTFKLTEYIGPGKTKTYNMIIFGFADIYGGADIKNEAMADDIKEFINTGQSVMFTHDNLTFRVDQSSGWARNFTRYFRDFVGQDMYSDGDYPNPGYVTLGFSDMAIERANGQGFKVSNNVFAFNDGIMTNYPYALIKGGVDNVYDMTYGERLLNVAKTHYQYYQLDLNNEEVVVWYTLADANSRIDHQDPGNFYYTYSLGNVTYSGTGHSDLDKANSWEERKLFVNTILKAIRGANFAPEITIEGVNDGDKVGRTRTAMTFKLMAKDPDISDQYIGGEIYLDQNGDGIYTANELVKAYAIDNHTPGEADSALMNGIFEDVSLDLTLVDDSKNNFSFKVTVFDQKGATASKTYSFELVDSPSFEMGLSGPGGMLLGDQETYTAKALLNVPNLSVENRIKNISMEMGIYEDETRSKLVSITDGTTFDISNRSVNMTLAGNLMKDSLADIDDPYEGTISFAYETYSFDVTPKTTGDFYLSSEIKWSLESYGFSDDYQKGQSIKVRRGLIDYNIRDDFGASVNNTITGKVLHYSTLEELGDVNVPDLNNASSVYNVTIDNSNLVFGDDASELMETGYYVLLTEGFDGYGSMVSPALYVDYNNPQHVVDLVVNAQPISNYKWIHRGHSNTPGVYKPIEDTEVTVSELSFETFREFTTFEFAYDDSEASGHMNMTGLAISVDNGSNVVDVTSKFNHDTVTNSFEWNDAANKMPVGSYTFTFNHAFKTSALDGVLALYKLGDTITISAPNQANVDEVRVYNFPEVHTREYELSFYKLTIIK